MKRFTTLFILVFTSHLHAALPWIESDDIWLRDDIHRLADSGLVNGPITTWPNMWSGIARNIYSDKNTEDQSSEAFLSFLKLRNQFKKQQYNKQHYLLRLHASNEHQLLRQFGDSHREKIEASAETHYLGQHFAYKLKLTRTLSAQDGNNNRLDGSYLSGTFLNWNLTLGMLNKWWGPGWTSSLILSDNARPFPAVMLHRNDYQAFASPWLSWIGPWQFLFFMGQLEENRHIPNALIWGARLNFRPVSFLEIGMSRVAQLGGKGRSHSLNTLLESFAGKDNRAPNESDEPGNQLAGFDFRLHHRSTYGTVAFYSQLIGEDEAGGMPSKHLFQWGIEYANFINDVPYRFFFEYNDTAVRVHGFQDHEYNVAYDHSIYRTGYRYKKRAIGSTFDNDAETYTLGLISSLNAQHSIKADLSYLRLNRDDSFSLEQSVSLGANELIALGLQYRYYSHYGLFNVKLDVRNKEINAKQFDLDRIQLAVNWYREL